VINDARSISTNTELKCDLCIALRHEFPKDECQRSPILQRRIGFIAGRTGEGFELKDPRLYL